ncbi:response regulator transcription factor [Microbulbifer rhizosphaerae]|uniref:DNA-binding NarL/FixJ family response regulator n=1 Tax=Microbulbifer rhizosphaerae TaxID=1562603 RepID=A0A7W4WBB2_9GAMM|nr:response regulator transcription factor [Microbulbifer rhizosphaerae]MBB3061126.1 DNA-binding NarL/FixJ family response regulator [Microbulbifer rhizosphaerae]
MTVKVLITEDHELYRDGLRLLLQEAFPAVQVIEAGDFSTAKATLTAHRDIALVLFDIHIPGTSGLNGLKEIKARYPALPLVVVSTIDHQASIQQMLQLGADGFIAKTSSKATMVKALKEVMEGEVVIISGHDNDDLVALSPRQVDTLELLVLGLPNKEIAAQLNISPATVREYVSDILVLFGCDNRTQAVLKARQLGFILD